MKRILSGLWFAVLCWCFGLCGVVLAAGDVVLDGGGPTWLGYWLTHPAVATLLLILGITGIVVEVATVGSFGLFGVIGVASFALYFLGNVWTGHAGAGLVALFVAGLILLALEILVIPGFGVAGICGVLAIVISLIMAAPNPGTAALSFVAAVAVSIVLIVLTLKNRKTRNLWRRLILFNRQENQAGYVSGKKDLNRFLGMVGRSATVLRPAGSALFQGEKVDVVTQGEFIPAERDIQVVAVEGSRVVVREIHREQP